MIIGGPNTVKPHSKVCARCLQEKHVTEFEQKRNQCKACVAARRRDRYAADPQPFRDRENAKYDAIKRSRKHARAKTNRRLSLILAGVRHRCKKRDLAFDLDHHRAELEEMFEEGRCALTGIAFNLEADKAWNSPSIDRIKPDGGYVFGNVRFILWAVNAGLGNWGEEIFMEVASAFLEKRNEPA